MTRACWSGEALAKTVVASTMASNAASFIASTSAPRAIRQGSSPTSWHILRVTKSVSPVSCIWNQSCLVRPLIKEHRRVHHQDEAENQPGEAAGAAVEAGLLAGVDDGVGQGAEIGPRPGVPPRRSQSR
jgi:hypothetical protein